MEAKQTTRNSQRCVVFSQPLSRLELVTLGILLLMIMVGIFLPRGTSRSGKSIESSLRMNLQVIRNAIVQFHEDTGRYPLVLTDLAQPDAQHLRTPVKKGSYHGPYLRRGEADVNNTGLPPNPFVSYLHDDHDLTHHWRYNPKTGKVHSAVSGTTTDGQSYTAL